MMLRDPWEKALKQAKIEDFLRYDLRHFDRFLHPFAWLETC